MWHVLAEPWIRDKLFVELHNATRKGQLSAYIGYDKALRELPYFQACLTEAMRLQPAVGLSMSRVVASPQARVDEHTSTFGTKVAVNAWVVHRDQDVFGQDAAYFRPERWIDDGKHKDWKSHKKYMTDNLLFFGKGLYQCTGRWLALLELKKLLPQLLRNYRFELVNPKRPLKQFSGFMVEQSGLNVTVETW
jgi:cytochrome P450